MEFVYGFTANLAASAVQVMMPKLFNYFKTKTRELQEVDDKIKELRATYIQIEAMLDQMDCWQIDNTAMEPWLQDLVGYCYDTEDLVDEIILSLSNKQQEEKPVQRLILRSRQVNISGQIGKLQEKLEGIIKVIERILPEASSSKQPHTRVKPSPYSNSLLLDEVHLVAGTSRDYDKQTIILKLMSQQHPHGVSIIGMDGLGKTTLARTIRDDERIKSHFPLILSACVSGDFQAEDIVQKLVADHSRRPGPHNYHEPTEPHQNSLQGILRSHRSLIILDDLWNVTDEAWETFRCNYLNSSQGSKILTTTRNPQVAEVTQSTSFYLNKMTDEDCKKLIIHRAGLSKSDCENWSNEIEVISKKCEGMPIIANKLGLRLSKKQRGSERKATIIEFKTNDLWDLQEFREVFPSLNLNEPKLPPDLKRCFAYCSLFFPSHEFNRDDLLQLWEAEGFVQPQQTHQTSLFDGFLSRSILHPYNMRGNKQGTYKMHEFNHKFAHLLASKVFCRVDEGTPNLPPSSENIRHLSIARQNLDGKLLQNIEHCQGLRTFLLLPHDKPKTCELSPNFLGKLQRLRLLDLSRTNIASIPKPMFPSKHLRYLDLSYTKVERLPEPIRILRVLQILKLKKCSRLLQLPRDLNQLINLNHFHVDMKTLGSLPSNLGKLTNLETLDSFRVGKDEGFKVTELKNMGHLREIHISGLENILDKEEAQEAMLSQKPSLRTLVLKWDSSVETATTVLEGLEPHRHLQDLVVRKYCGQKFPSWLISPSCQLVNIKLENCRNCQVLPSLGQLPFLTTLVIHAVHNVKVVDNHFYGQGQSQRAFPSLELLEVRDMKGLANWTGLEEENMPCLSALKIFGCPELVNLPSLKHLSCLANLEINRCPKLQSLPELPSSLNGELRELIIMESALITERCQTGGADWQKFKEISYVEIDAKIISTTSSIERPDGDKDKVPTNEHQPSTSVNLNNEKKVSQVHQGKVPRSQSCPTTPPRLDEVHRSQCCPTTPLRLGDENHTLKDVGTRSEDQPTSSQFQPTITIHSAGKNHNLQNIEQDRSSLQSLVDESQMVQPPNDQNEFPEKEHHSLVHPNPADESCTSQHEGPRSEQPLLAPPKLVDKIPPPPVNKNLTKAGENAPRKDSSSGLSYFLKGCFFGAK